LDIFQHFVFQYKEAALRDLRYFFSTRNMSLVKKFEAHLNSYFQWNFRKSKNHSFEPHIHLFCTGFVTYQTFSTFSCYDARSCCLATSQIFSLTRNLRLVKKFVAHLNPYFQWNPIKFKNTHFSSYIFQFMTKRRNIRQIPIIHLISSVDFCKIQESPHLVTYSGVLGWFRVIYWDYQLLCFSNSNVHDHSTSSQNHAFKAWIGARHWHIAIFEFEYFHTRDLLFFAKSKECVHICSDDRFWEDYLTLRNRVRKQVLCYKLAPIVNQFIIAKH